LSSWLLRGFDTKCSNWIVSSWITLPTPLLLAPLALVKVLLLLLKEVAVLVVVASFAEPVPRLAVAVLVSSAETETAEPWP
jgi:hypothetical protein